MMMRAEERSPDSISTSIFLSDARPSPPPVYRTMHTSIALTAGSSLPLYPRVTE